MVLVLKYEQVKGLSDEQFRRLTGVKRSTFDRMIKILEGTKVRTIKELSR